MVVAASAWQQLFDRLASGDGTALAAGLREAPLTADETTVQRAFAAVDPSGRIAAECWSDYGKKAAALDAHRTELASVIQEWPTVAARLRTWCVPRRNSRRAWSRPARRLVWWIWNG